MSSADRAVELFGAGFNCAQAVAGGCGPAEGVDEATCLVTAACFGGGLCRTAETCGAVTGALMVLGMRHGKLTLVDPARKSEVYAIGADFLARFRNRHGSIVCRELLGCDISTAEGSEQAKRDNLHTSRCTEFVRDAAEILAEMP